MRLASEHPLHRCTRIPTPRVSLERPLETDPCPQLPALRTGRPNPFLQSIIHSTNQLTHLLVVPSPARGARIPDTSGASLQPGLPSLHCSRHFASSSRAPGSCPALSLPISGEGLSASPIVTPPPKDGTLKHTGPRKGRTAIFLSPLFSGDSRTRGGTEFCPLCP